MKRSTNRVSCLTGRRPVGESEGVDFVAGGLILLRFDRAVEGRLIDIWVC